MIHIKQIIKNFSNKSFNRIFVNGKEIACSGRNISVINGKVSVDGKVVEDNLTGDITVVVDGDVSSIECDGDVTVNGNCESGIDCGGSCTVAKYVRGNINAGGSVDCGDVDGYINAGGSVRCVRQR